MDQASLREKLAAAYAAGALGPGLALLAETQAELSPDAARDLATAEATAGALLERESPVPLAASALEKVFARIAAAEDRDLTSRTRASRAVRAHVEEIEALPARIREVALKALHERGWTFSGFGIRTLTLDAGDDAHVELIRIEPGVATPRHTHEGDEYTLVLTGAFHDERGRYDRGDIAVAGPGITHRPTAEPGAVCYNLAVSEAALKFTGLLGALQRMVKH